MKLILSVLIALFVLVGCTDEVVLLPDLTDRVNENAGNIDDNKGEITANAGRLTAAEARLALIDALNALQDLKLALIITRLDAEELVDQHGIYIVRVSDEFE